MVLIAKIIFFIRISKTVVLALARGLTYLREESKRLQDEFDRKYPPITDEEYLAGFPPGTDPEIALGVRRVLADALAINEEQIYATSTLMELGAN